MQNKPSNDQHKSIYYRLRRSDPHERLSARLRHFSFGAAVFFVVAAAGIVTHSLYNIQIKQGATFRQYAAQQQLLDSTIQATRGEIYDASGITLASTSVVWTIWADPSYSTALFTSQTVEETGEAVKTVDETTLADVSRQLTLRLLSGDGESLDSVDTSSAEYQTQYQTVHDALAKNDSSYQVLATKVNNAVKLSIEKYISEYNKDHAKAKTLEDGTVIKKGRVSVSSSKSFQRDYPYGAFAASVLGFCNGDGEGFYGLEKSYNDTLAGVNGRTITLRNAYGNAIADANATTYAAKDGSNLVLSLDVNVQEVVERYLNEAIYANTVENRGAAIVMNVKTGAILAMASKPDFDPNAPLDFSENLAYLNEQVNAEPEIYTIYKKDTNGNYLRDEQGKKIPEEAPDYIGTYRDIQWKNKTITELYYPGSVFKVITAAMGVDSGKATYYTTFNCSGAYGVAKETYHCAGKKAHGVQNLAEALRNSCNIYFIQLGQRLGPSAFYDYFDAFGFTERTGVDLPNETGMMKYYTKSQLGEVELSSSSFGQAMAVTPLQVCTPFLLLIVNLHSDIVASWQRWTIDVAGVAVPSLVEVLLVRIGDVLHTAIHLKCEILVDGEVVCQLEIYLHEFGSVYCHGCFNPRACSVTNEHTASVVSGYGSCETLHGCEGSCEVAVCVWRAHHLLVLLFWHLIVPGNSLVVVALLQSKSGLQHEPSCEHSLSFDVQSEYLRTISIVTLLHGVALCVGLVELAKRKHIVQVGVEAFYQEVGLYGAEIMIQVG